MPFYLIRMEKLAEMRLLASKSREQNHRNCYTARRDGKGEIPEHRLTAVYEPMINLILTGSKSMTVGDKTGNIILPPTL